MRIQKTDWGYIEWMDSSDYAEEASSLRMGKVYILKDKRMLPHVHYEEQFVYVLSGRGIGYINGTKQEFEPGVMVHMPAGCTHEFVNIGEESFIHLLVSSPVSIDPDSLIDKREPNKEITPNRFYSAVEAVRTQFLETLKMAYVIRDVNGRVVLKSEHFPSFCVKTCGIQENNACACMRWNINKNEISENTFICPYGLTIYQVPVCWEKQCLGSVQGGYIRQSFGNDTGAEVYDTPESSAFGLLQLLRKVAKAMRNYCEFDQYRRVLFEKEKSLSSSLTTQKILLDHLRDTEHTVANLKINNHFLFNTLNSMAAMALEGGMMPLYQSIIDLSKMLRYSVRIQESMIPLQMELEYLEAYLKLQKLRYPNDLNFTIWTEGEIASVFVPFNFLQPVVENAFTHGFHGCKEKIIRVVVKRDEDQVKIIIENNGETITQERCAQIEMQMKSGTSHGLSLVYEKLKAAYDDDFVIGITPKALEGICITILVKKICKRSGVHDKGSDL